MQLFTQIYQLKLIPPTGFYNKFYRAIVGLARFFLLYLRRIFHVFTREIKTSFTYKRTDRRSKKSFRKDFVIFKKLVSLHVLSWKQSFYLKRTNTYWRLKRSAVKLIAFLFFPNLNPLSFSKVSSPTIPHIPALHWSKKSACYESATYTSRKCHLYAANDGL